MKIPLTEQLGNKEILKKIKGESILIVRTRRSLWTHNKEEGLGKPNLTPKIHSEGRRFRVRQEATFLASVCELIAE